MRPDEIIRKILEIRGIVSEEDVREFLSSKPKLSHDPKLMPGMDEGARFLLGALSGGKRICIYGDYDVDGVCGIAIFVLFLREAASLFENCAEITYYVPSRLEEGYGLNKGALLAIREEGTDVVVTVDCGGASPDETVYARELGLDMLVTDHHDADPEKPPDCVFINPKSGGYPFTQLAGAGVAFKLCSALVTLMEEEQLPARDLRLSIRGLIDLVCVATVADVMPLVDENRTFVKYGGSMLRLGTRPAFRALLSIAGIEQAKLCVRDVAFGIAPRLNALGRLGSASEAVEFFLTDDEDRMREISERMERFNSERRFLQEKCFRECMALFEAGASVGEDGKNAGFLLLRPADSHEGVIGIVAGKVRDATGLPCAVLTEARDYKGVLKGSARSQGRLDIISLMRRHSGLFEKLGGHAAAAGFTIEERNEDRLRTALSGDIIQMLDEEPDLLKDEKEAELEIRASDVTFELTNAIERLAPFGAGNPKPALSMSVAADRITGIRSMGQEGKHLRFSADGIPCVFFDGAKTSFPGAGTVQVIGCPEVNEWNGNRNIQFAVRHINVLK